jgi:hypothetical protein
MAADDATSPAFFSGPAVGESTVLLPPALATASAPSGGGRFAVLARHLRLRCLPPFSAGPQAVILRPLAEQTDRAPGMVAAWLHYRRPE